MKTNNTSTGISDGAVRTAALPIYFIQHWLAKSLRAPSTDGRRQFLVLFDAEGTKLSTASSGMSRTTHERYLKCNPFSVGHSTASLSNATLEGFDATRPDAELNSMSAAA